MNPAIFHHKSRLSGYALNLGLISAVPRSSESEVGKETP